jgi:hypothetical protein
LRRRWEARQGWGACAATETSGGICYLSMGQYAKAIALLGWGRRATTWALCCALLCAPIAEHAAEASLGQASDAPHNPSSLSEGIKGRAEEAERWLRIALEGGLLYAHLQLSHLAFDMGREEEALAHLKLYLAWCVERAHGRCEGCGKVRDEERARRI